MFCEQKLIRRVTMTLLVDIGRRVLRERSGARLKYIERTDGICVKSSKGMRAARSCEGCAAVCTTASGAMVEKFENGGSIPNIHFVMHEAASRSQRC